ncbi:fructosamine-3-kinase [Stackebrandtia endophytica]|uniref:Fructosamine-3-kinase n=2 Tax=Stackebrandtia endophytica TaxID=1496996 RepID=A0A543AYB4_9ACTN|nr:fructosamine-3-kinase [Stackebrandtia endophytica]
MFIEHQRIRFTPVPGGSTGVAQRLTLDDGSDVFAKLTEDGPEGISTAEANGLHWLAEAKAPVPTVWCHTESLLVTDWLEPGEPTPDRASELGRSLASMHRSGATRLGAPWPGFIGVLPLDNRGLDDTSATLEAPGSADVLHLESSRHQSEPDSAHGTPVVPTVDWPQWFVLRRLEPFLKLSHDNGALDDGDTALVSTTLARVPGRAGPPEPIARLHGDLWPGNLHWSTDRCWLIDPAAHGGHRETDLATLALWGGAPFLDRVLAGYQEVWPLADGWHDRIRLHQLHLLLVHTARFGRRYRDEVLEAAAGV